MKKLVSLLLVLTMVFALASVSLAETRTLLPAEGSLCHAAAFGHHLPDVEGLLRRPDRRAGRAV